MLAPALTLVIIFVLLPAVITLVGAFFSFGITSSAFVQGDQFILAERYTVVCPRRDSSAPAVSRN